jgi:hypothetical protein
MIEILAIQIVAGRPYLCAASYAIATRLSLYQVREEDMARLSPFVSSHLNLYLDMLRIRYVAPVWAATRICPLAAMNNA